jgi:signal transduction histidine kinase
MKYFSILNFQKLLSPPYRRLFCLSFITLICSFVSGQELRSDNSIKGVKSVKSDTTLYQEYSGKYNKFFLVNKDSALHYTILCIELSRKNKILSSEAHSLTRKASVLMLMGKYPDAFNELNNALRIAEKPFTKNSFWFNDTSLNIYKRKNSLLASIHFQMGQMYKAISNKEFQDFHFKESVNFSKLAGEGDGFLAPQFFAIANEIFYSNATVNILELDRMEKLIISDSTSPMLMTMSFAKGRAYLLQGNYSKAKESYWNVLNKFKKGIKNEAALSGSFLDLSRVYNITNESDSNLYYARKGFALIQKFGTSNVLNLNISNAYYTLSEAFYHNADPDSAYYYQTLALRAKDSIYQSELSRMVEFQNESNKQKLRFQELQNKAKANQNRIRMFGVLGILGAVLIFTILMIRNYRIQSKAKSQIEKAFSELRDTQQQLIHSEKMASLGELTAGIAHEIQNPLNFVNNFSEVSTELVDEMNEEMAKGNYDDAKEIANDVKQNLEKINHHGKRAGDIVKGMLQHSRSSSGIKEPTDINALCDEYLRLSYHGLRAKDKSFTAIMKTDFDERIGKINIIPQDIGRVILNLINNAFYTVAEKKKQQSEGYEPTVTVSTSKNPHSEGRGAFIEIGVSDNGNGIPQKVLDKIFQPFFTTKPTGQGTGLGLSLSYDIVKAHGGELKVETKEREGSEFIIILPIIN